MKFTLVFPSQEANDLSIGMVFTPCITWMHGNTALLNPHPQIPEYQLGDFQQLIDLPLLKSVLSKATTLYMHVIIHNEGHCTQHDLDMLTYDAHISGFSVHVHRTPNYSTQGQKLTLYPYKYNDTWVFDDQRVSLEKEAFVQGVDLLIDAVTKHIPNAEAGFELTFSDGPFDGYQMQ